MSECTRNIKAHKESSKLWLTDTKYGGGLA